MRAHPRYGQQGPVLGGLPLALESGPLYFEELALGREYFLENWEIDKNVYNIGIVNLRIGPVLDIGRIGDPGTNLGSHEWLFDTGALLKLRVFGSGFVLSYGRDLRNGTNAVYAELLE